MDPAMRVVIVDDDFAARVIARRAMQREADVEIVGEAADGAAAVSLIHATQPDVVLLDVQLPDRSGFDVIAAVGASVMPPLIFMSAYADFAVRAFEAYALDYVLKPYQPDRLREAMARARPVVHTRRQGMETDSAESRLHALLAQLARGTMTRYPESLAVKLGDQYHVLRVSEIEWIEADGNHARVHTEGRARVITKSLALLERQVLDPSQFLRVHRGAIVNVHRIVAVEPALHGDVELVLRSGQRVDCSRRFRARLEERMFFTS